MSTLVNEFILRRTNNINAKHLPPKLVQVRFSILRFGLGTNPEHGDVRIRSSRWGERGRRLLEGRFRRSSVTSCTQFNTVASALSSPSPGSIFPQVVCCRLTPVQRRIYKHLLSSKEIRHILNGKQTNILSSIGAMQKVTTHARRVPASASRSRAVF